MPESTPSVPPGHGSQKSARWALDDALFGQCRLALEDFVHAVRQEPRTRRLVQLAMLAGAALLVVGAWLIHAGRSRTGILGSLLGCACFAGYHLPEQIARRWFARTPPAARLVKYTLGPQGLIVASELSHEVHPWRGLYGYQEVPESFLIWVSAKLFLIVPKRAFAALDVPRVAERLEREVGAPPALPRFWSWLGLATLLAVLALWLWNHLSPR